MDVKKQPLLQEPVSSTNDERGEQASAAATGAADGSASDQKDKEPSTTEASPEASTVKRQKKKRASVEAQEDGGAPAAHAESEEEGEPKRVTKVFVDGRLAINRVEITYSDGSVWAMGAPLGGAVKRAGAKKDERFRPLILADDEYLVQVRHESLPQWWWPGAGVEFTTNKGRSLQAQGHWASGLAENMQEYRAAPGNAIHCLKLHNGCCYGIVEAPMPRIDEGNLQLWAVYWLPQDVENGGVEHRTFAGRDAAFRFAERIGGGRELACQCGPFRLSMSDHPWLDGLRDFRELLSFTRLQALDARSVEVAPAGARASSSSAPLATRLEAPADEALNPERLDAAGIIVDIITGSRAKAWGPSKRRRACEELAADHGLFDLLRWRNMSLSFANGVEHLQAMRPIFARLITMLNLRRHALSAIFMTILASARSLAEGVQTVLSGAVFNLVNSDEDEVKKQSRYLHAVCSWTFGCGTRMSLAKSIILGLLLLAIFKGILRVISQRGEKAFKDAYRAEQRSALFEHVLAQDLEEFDKQTTKVMANKATPQVLDGLPSMVSNLIQSATQLATSILFLYSISPLLTLVYGTLVPIFQSAAQAYLRRQARATIRRENGLESISSRVVGECCDMIRVVKTFSREEWHTNLQKLALQEAANAKLTMGQAVAQVCADTLQQAIYCFALWLALVWMDLDFSAAEMTAFLLLMNTLGQRVNSFRNQVESFMNRSDSLSEYFDFLDQEPKIAPGTHAGVVEGKVDFKDVVFAYPARPEQVVLHGLSLTLHPGNTTALVGSSGSGKSTVVQLIFRYYDPRSGQIIVDGVPLVEWNLSHLHHYMALVAQEPLLFNTSIRQNLLYGVPDCHMDSDPAIFEDRMFAAAKAACAHDFIMTFPGGYDTYVGDRGGQISGGQKQRISVARAMLMSPRILVLDEATSALDSESESVVQEALDRLVSGSGSSVLVIAHRLSTVRHANEIICLREGSVVERGSSQALIERKGYYFRLVEKQAVTLNDIKGVNEEIDQFFDANEVPATPHLSPQVSRDAVGQRPSLPTVPDTGIEGSGEGEAKKS